jgi:phospholipase B1
MVQGFGQCKAKQKTIVGCLCNGLPEELAQKTRLVMDELSLEYRKRLEKLAQEYQKRQYNDFTVVYDSGFAETEFKNASVDVISGADCFHPSVNAHNRAGISMWNNLFRAQKMKMEVRRPGKVFCPDELSRLWSP